MSFSKIAPALTMVSLAAGSLAVAGTAARATAPLAGCTVYVADQGNSNTVTVIDPSTNTATGTIAAGDRQYGLAASPDGSRLYVTNNSGSLTVVDTSTNTVTGTIGLGGLPFGVAVSPDGALVYVSDFTGQTLKVVSPSLSQVVATVPLGASPRGLALTPDGTRVYVATGDINNPGTVSVIETAGNTVVATITVDTVPGSVAVSPDGRRVYVTSATAGTVSVIDSDANSNTIDHVLTAVNINAPSSVVVHPDNTRLFVADVTSNNVSVVDLDANSGSFLTVIVTPAAGYPQRSIAISPDGTRLYATKANGNEVAVINTATYTRVASVTTGGSDLYGVALACQPPSLSPSTQIVSGTTGTAVTDSTAFTASGFGGSVSYLVTSGTLPAGLALDPSTGVISGTPTAASTATVTITASDGTATATATVAFAIVAAPASQAPVLPPVVSDLVAQPVATAPPRTTPPPTTQAPAPTTTVPSAVPQLVNSSNQSTLARTPGAATALVNGQAVEAEVIALADQSAAQIAPEARTPEQVAALQRTAATLVADLARAAAGDPGVVVVPTATGAELEGVLRGTPVPVEDVIIVKTPDISALFAAVDPTGAVVKVKPGAVLEVNGDGEVGVVAYGLTPGEPVELVIMSTPTLLGTSTVASDGTVRAQADLPDGIGAGDHTLVMASRSLQASLGVLVASKLPTPEVGVLPATGGSPTTPLLLVLMLVASGAMVAVVTRRRTRLG